MKKGSVKRLLAVALASVLAVGCLTGCGGAKSSADAVSYTHLDPSCRTGHLPSGESGEYTGTSYAFRVLYGGGGSGKTDQ